MTSRKARNFRLIFAQNFLKIHTFFINYWYFLELSCDKKNLKWNYISYGIYETRCMFYIPSPQARGYKTHNSFHKYRMKWKFISDPIYLQIFKANKHVICDWQTIMCYMQMKIIFYIKQTNTPTLYSACCFKQWTSSQWGLGFIAMVGKKSCRAL